MLGAIIGDTVGSVYEFNNIKRTDFEPLFNEKANYTDDTIMTVAVGDWLVNTDRSEKSLEEKLVYWATKYPCPMGGYGGGFSRWLFHPEYVHEYRDENHPKDEQMGERHPYNSWGNGAAMRASACGWVAYSEEEAMELGKRSAEITHNHPEGIKGAQAVATAIYLALSKRTKEEIRNYIEKNFGYDLHHTCDDIRATYQWDSSCQGTVPPALIAFYDSHSFEEAIRLAVSLGGDSDTLACITGGIAEAYYYRNKSEGKGITYLMVKEMKKRLPIEMQRVVMQVTKGVTIRHLDIRLNMITKEEKYAKEEEFLRHLAKAYQTYELGDIANYLSPRMLYTSFFDYNDLHSKKEYLAHLKHMLKKRKRRGEMACMLILYQLNDGKPFLIPLKRYPNGYVCVFCEYDDQFECISEVNLFPESFYQLGYKDEEEMKQLLARQEEIDKEMSQRNIFQRIIQFFRR